MRGKREDRIVKQIIGALAATVLLTGTAFGAEAIVGSWKTKSGENAKISPCGGSYCVTLTTGKYSGKRIGRMKGSGGKYSGTITDPSNDRKYSGSASVSGKSMKMRGCALKVFCRTETWRKL